MWTVLKKLHLIDLEPVFSWFVTQSSLCHWITSWLAGCVPADEAWPSPVGSWPWTGLCSEPHCGSWAAAVCVLVPVWYLVATLFWTWSLSILLQDSRFDSAGLEPSQVEGLFSFLYGTHSPSCLDQEAESVLEFAVWHLQSVWFWPERVIQCLDGEFQLVASVHRSLQLAAWNHRN